VAQGGGGGDESDGPTFGGILAQLKEEAELLKQTARQREINAEILRIEDQLKRDLTDTERGLLRAQLEQNRQLKERANLLEEIKGPERELERRQANLTALFDQGKISLQEYTEEMRRLRVELTAQDNSLFGGVENGLARLAERSNDFGKNVSNVVVGAFDEAGNAVADYAKTGKFNFKDFASSVQDQLLKLATNQLFSQLAGFALNAFGGGFGGGIGLGLGLGGAGSQGLTGFAEGGTFDVNRQNSIGTTSGRDNRIVAFKANDSEEVEVRKKGSSKKQDGGGSPMYINFNITTPDADSFRRSQSQIFADAQAAMARAGRRNG
jgi:phage-related minor tail protein